MERKLEQLLKRSIDLLPKDDLAPENGAVRAVVGIKDPLKSGPRIQRGVYRFTELQKRDGNQYILVQDTALASPIVKGLIVENGEIVDAVGFGNKKLGSRRMRSSVRELLIGFLSCERYLTIERG